MEKRQILIVEDVPMISDYMELVLSRQGYRVAAAVPSGEEALVAAQTAAPDLVLMDIRLAGSMDGIETAERIRQAHGIPIVFVSAYTELDVIQKAMATGASGFIIKPFKVKDLLFAVKRALGMQSSEELTGETFMVNHPSCTSRMRNQVDS
jgi:CheY-like chemotaxis protein